MPQLPSRRLGTSAARKVKTALRMVWVNNDCNLTSFPCLDVPWRHALNQTTWNLHKNHLCLFFVSEISFRLEVWVLGCPPKGQKRIVNGMGK